MRLATLPIKTDVCNEASARFSDRIEASCSHAQLLLPDYGATDATLSRLQKSGKWTLVRGFNRSSTNVFSYTSQMDPFAPNRQKYKEPFSEIVVLRIMREGDEPLATGLARLRKSHDDGQGSLELRIQGQVDRLVAKGAQ